MKSHPSKTNADWLGMNSSIPPDRIDDRYCAYLRNGHIDRDGRVVKTNGVSIVATAASLGLTSTSAAQRLYNIVRFTGRQGQHPNSKAIAVLSGKICRSKDNDLMSRWDDVTYNSTDETPALGLPMAIAFRQNYAYLQNGQDMPMRLKCEQDDAGTLTTQAETLGLRPPAMAFQFNTYTAGNQRRFPPNVSTSWCVTFVYGTRGESGPSPTMTLSSTTGDGTNDTVNFRYIPLGPTGCTARRIYRTPIGRGATYSSGNPSYGYSHLFDGPPVTMYLAHTINDNTTTTWSDATDDAQLDFTTPNPLPRALVPRAKYQTMHLGRLFWANVKDHPWTLGVLADPSFLAYLGGVVGFTVDDYRVSISNAGGGTITFDAHYNSAWHTEVTISNYKTTSLQSIVSQILAGVSFLLANSNYSSNAAVIVPGGLDRTRSHTFNEVTNQSILNQAYWFVAQDGVTGSDGPEVHTNRFVFADPVFPEQVDLVNSDDLTQGGSNEITGMSVLDNALMLQSFEDTFAVSGTFIPDNSGNPEFRVDRIQAAAGNICQRPDAVVSVPEIGNLQFTKDGLRRQRGVSSIVAGEPVYDWFTRILRDPPARDNVSADYDAGVYRLALPVDESP